MKGSIIIGRTVPYLEALYNTFNCCIFLCSAVLYFLGLYLTLKCCILL